MEPDKTYCLRLINAETLIHLNFQIEKHDMVYVKVDAESLFTKRVKDGSLGFEQDLPLSLQLRRLMSWLIPLKQR